MIEPRSPVALIGMACRLLGTGSLSSFWQWLNEGPKNQRSIDDVTLAALFHLKQASIQPFQPLLASLWEGLEHASWDATSHYQDIGLYCAVDSTETAQLKQMMSLMMQRFQWRGISMAFGGSATMGLQALSSAMEDIRLGKVATAIVGAQNESSAAVLILRSWEDAATHRDQIWAALNGCVVRQDHRRCGGAPSTDAWVQLIVQTAMQANIPCCDVSFIVTDYRGSDAHDDRVYDQAEFGAYRAMYGRNQRELKLCVPRSLFGDLGIVRGLAAVITVALCMRHQWIPARPLVMDYPVAKKWTLLNAPVRWPSLKPRIAAVTVLDDVGDDGHLMMSSVYPPPERAKPGRRWRLVTLSGHSPEGLQVLKKKLLEDLSARGEDVLDDWVYSLNVGRSDLAYRQWWLCRDKADVLDALDQERPIHGVSPSDHPKLAFFFPGQEPDLTNLGADLYQTEPLFRDEMDLIVACLADRFGLDGLGMIQAPEGHALWRRRADDANYLPLLLCASYAYAKTLDTIGMVPKALVGFGLGELTAAAVNHVIPVEEALGLAHLIGTHLKTQPRGRMLAVFQGVADIEPHLGGLSIAAVIHPQLTVLSGSEQDLNRFRRLHHRTLMLDATHAFHSNHMDALYEPLYERTDRMGLARPRTPQLSATKGDWLTARDALSPDYWSRLLQRPVNIDRSIRSLNDDGVTHIVEAGPHTRLSRAIQRHPSSKATVWHVQGQDADLSFLNLLGQFWSAGGVIDWSMFYRHEERRRMALPTYPLSF